MIRRGKSATFPGLRTWGKFFIFLMVALMMAACSPASKSGEELRGEVQDLKKEVKSMQEKLDKLQAGQQTMLELLQKAAQPPQAVQQLQQPSQPLTVSQLLASGEQYVGSRVTVKGKAGPIMMNRKSLFMMAPEGMVEVLLGSLPDKLTVNRLTSTPLDKPVTVTGTVSLPAKATSAKLQITAEAVDF